MQFVLFPISPVFGARVTLWEKASYTLFGLYGMSFLALTLINARYFDHFVLVLH
jgi:hypothetical protein